MIKNKLIKIAHIIIEKMRMYNVLDVLMFFGLRFTLGLTKGYVNLYALFLLLIGVSIERVTLIFFSIAIIMYILGGWVEANFYFSYVYIGLVLSVVKYFYLAYKDRKSHQ